MYRKLAYLIKHNSVFQFLYRVVFSTFFRFFGLLVKTDPQLVLLSSYGGRQYGDSPRVLFETMKNDSRFHGYKYFWAFEDPKAYSISGANSININSFKYFYVALKAKLWITNVNIERGLNFKKKSTVYLNTWHGTGPKKGGNAVRGRKDYDFSRVDIFCCDGQYMHDIFVKWFNASDESMIWCGRPREDELMGFTDSDRLTIRKKLEIPEDKRMILYMPTWREYGNKALNYTLWEQMLSNKYVLFIRSHHFSTDLAYTGENNVFFRDITTYPNVNELYCAADILISDYSSAFFDYGLLGKPMLCYAYDYNRYNNEYGLFMDLEHEFPGGIIKDENQLIQTLLTLNYSKASELSKSYVDRYVRHPVNATACCLEEIYQKMRNRQ